MMWVFHFTLNSVTMLALVLMVGIVIDDAIVVLENIFRFVEEKGWLRSRPRGRPRPTSTRRDGDDLSLVVIFIPVSFMSSISAASSTSSASPRRGGLVSLLVSFTLTPMMSARLLGGDAARKQGAPHSRGGFYRWIDAGYERLLALALQHRGSWRWSRWSSCCRPSPCTG